MVHKQTITRFVLIIMLGLMLVSCAPQSAAPVPTATIKAMPSATFARKVTATTRATATPVRPGLPAPVVPEVSVPISAENISQLTRLASLGEGDLLDVKISPDGKWIVFNTSNGVLVLDAFSLERELFLPTSMKPKKVSFIDGGTKLRAQDCFQGYTWSFPEGKEISHVQFAKTDLNWPDYWPCQVTPDNNWEDVFSKFITDQKPGLYRINTGEAIFLSDGDYWGVVFSPDNELIVINTSENLVFLQHQDGKILQELPEKGIKWLFFYPDGKTVAAVFENQTKFWNVEDFKLLDTVNGTGLGDIRLQYPEFSPDNSILVFRRGDTFRLLRAVDRTYINAVSGYGIRFTPDSKGVIVDNGSGSINYYQFNEDRSKIDLITSFSGRGFGYWYHYNSSIPGAFSDDNTKLLVVKTTGNEYLDDLTEILVYDLVSGEVNKIVVDEVLDKNKSWYLREAIWLPELHTFGVFVQKNIISESYEFYRVDLNSNTLLPVITSTVGARVTTIEFSPNSDLLVYSHGSQLVSWDIKNNGYWNLPTTQIDPSNQDWGQSKIRFLENGKHIQFFDLLGNSYDFNGEDYSLNGQITVARFPFGIKNASTLDRTYSASMKRGDNNDPNMTLTVIDNNSGNTVLERSERWMDFTFSADSRMIAISINTMHGNKILIYDILSGEELFSTGDYFCSGDVPPTVVFSADGKYLGILTEFGYPQIWGIP